MVDYFSVDGYPGRYFSCTRYGTMSAGACAKNYTAAPEASKSGRLSNCVGCQIGRAHSGAELPAEKPQPAAVVYRTACFRCRRSGSDSSNLIGRMRLVRGHTICVSCYNREREVLVGANSKGVKPKKWSGLFIPDLAYIADGHVVREKLPTPVRDRFEAVLTVIRAHAAHGVMWARPSIQVVSAEV